MSFIDTAASFISGFDSASAIAVLDVLLKVTLLLGAASLVSLALGRASAAVRHMVWTPRSRARCWCLCSRSRCRAGRSPLVTVDAPAAPVDARRRVRAGGARAPSRDGAADRCREAHGCRHDWQRRLRRQRRRHRRVCRASRSRPRSLGDLGSSASAPCSPVSASGSSPCSGCAAGRRRWSMRPGCRSPSISRPSSASRSA